MCRCLNRALCRREELRKRRTSYLVVVLAARATFRYDNTRNLHSDKAINLSKQFSFQLALYYYLPQGISSLIYALNILSISFII